MTVVKLSPDNPDAVLSMLEQFNAACNALSKLAFEEKIFRWLPLQRRAYQWLRETFGLTSAQAVVTVRKVAYAYSSPKQRGKIATFAVRGAIPVYQHSYKHGNLVRLYGFSMPFEARPAVHLSGKHEAKLIYDRGQFLLHQVIDPGTGVEAEEGQAYAPQDFIGVDLGIVNLASDSDGEVFSGQRIEDSRRRYVHRRRNLQRKQTRPAKRKLKAISRKQARYQRDVNHCISKKIVAKAKDTRRGIALENLTGIRERITVRRRQRARQSNWGFAQLREFIVYKATLLGVPLAVVDPRNTSRTCPACGHSDKANRPDQSHFRCMQCGFAGAADTVAAWNIRARARGDAPMVAALMSQ